MSPTMTSRERVLRTLRFEPADRAPLDFLEGIVWLEPFVYFRDVLGLPTVDDVLRHFDIDFRWYRPAYSGPAYNEPGTPVPLHITYSDQVGERPLRYVNSIPDALSRQSVGKPEWWDASGATEFRRQWPDHAIVLHCGWMPAFGITCEAFGFETALERMHSDPALFESVLHRHNDFLVRLLERVCSQAEGQVELCWLGDDYADQRCLIMGPNLWRRFIKEPLRRQAEVVHRHGMRTILHSCGAVREIIPDLIEIGIDCLEVFQTSAEGMDPESIARDFGGKIAFNGGIDVQHLLRCGTEEEVRREVRRNINAFADYGGYMVANSHVMPDTRPANLAAMFEEGRKYRPRRK